MYPLHDRVAVYPADIFPDLITHVTLLGQDLVTSLVTHYCRHRVDTLVCSGCHDTLGMHPTLDSKDSSRKGGVPWKYLSGLAVTAEDSQYAILIGWN